MKLRVKKPSMVIYVLVALLCASLAGCGGSKEADTTEKLNGNSDLEHVKNKGTLVVGLTEYAPMGYRSQDAWAGFDVELAEGFAKELGVTVEYKEINWDDKVKLLENGTIDCIWNGMTMTDELAEQINCSSPYLSNAQTVVIPGNKEKQYETVEEYQHMLFAVESGSTGESLVKELKYRYVTYATQREAVESVDKNQCDAAVIDGVMASCYVGAGHEFENLAMGVSLNDEKICVGLRKGSNLTGKLEDYFIKVSEDGTFQSLAAAYGLEEAILSMEE